MVLWLASKFDEHWKQSFSHVEMKLRTTDVAEKIFAARALRRETGREVGTISIS
jgi:hypothetical protein